VIDARRVLAIAAVVTAGGIVGMLLSRAVTGV